jgi:hypothetical protein
VDNPGEVRVNGGLQAKHAWIQTPFLLNRERLPQEQATYIGRFASRISSKCVVLKFDTPTARANPVFHTTNMACGRVQV